MMNIQFFLFAPSPPNLKSWIRPCGTYMKSKQYQSWQSEVVQVLNSSTRMRRAEGGAKIFGVFRVKIHEFTQKKADYRISLLPLTSNSKK
jgi:hypothetical protein